jgi:transcriptional regulator with XRE-family HTH domain
MLRKGQRDNPTKKHLEALADFFGVPPAYFFDDDAAARISAELDLLIALRDIEVRQIALRATGLSAQSLATVREVVERVRQLEGLAESDMDRTESSG